MSILMIARAGHPVLQGRAAEVTDPGAPEIRRLVADMMETMEAAPGVGLAAPQVHVPIRLVVFRIPEGRGSGAADDYPLGNSVLINPVIEPLGPEMALGWEGCLSLPGLRGAVPRWTRIRYSGVDCDGNRIVREVGGFHAVVIQHECDHLDGVLYPMRMVDMSTLGFVDEIERVMQEQAASQEGMSA